MEKPTVSTNRFRNLEPKIEIYTNIFLCFGKHSTEVAGIWLHSVLMHNLWYNIACKRNAVSSWSASCDNWFTVGGDGGCRVGKVRAGTTSPMPDHKGFKLQ